MFLGLTEAPYPATHNSVNLKGTTTMNPMTSRGGVLVSRLLVPQMPRLEATLGRKGLFDLQFQDTVHQFREGKAGTQAAGHITPSQEQRETSASLLSACLFFVSFRVQPIKWCHSQRAGNSYINEQTIKTSPHTCPEASLMEASLSSQFTRFSVEFRLCQGDRSGGLH